MAIEFGSRKETFDNFKVYETMLAGRPFKVEMEMCIRDRYNSMYPMRTK